MTAQIATILSHILAPILGLASLILTLITFLAPVVIHNTSMALITIAPAVVEISSSKASSTKVDGPSVFMGILGSCSRSTNEAGVVCQSPSFAAHYNLTVLPATAPYLFTSPIPVTPLFVLLSLFLSLIFLVMYTILCVRQHLSSRLGEMLQKPVVERVVSWIGIGGFFVGLIAYFVSRIWFGKAIEDFNMAVLASGKGGPQLQAGAGSGFTLIWVAYAFMAVPVVCALMRMEGGRAGGLGKA